jgi:hypothetical protein
MAPASAGTGRRPAGRRAGGLFANRPADLLQHRQRLAHGMQCVATAPVEAARAQYGVDDDAFILLGERRQAEDVPVFLAQHMTDQIVPRVKPEGRLSCSRWMISTIAPSRLWLSRL